MHNCAVVHSDKTHRRRNRHLKKQLAPLHWWEQKEKSPDYNHWGNPDASRAKVKATPTNSILSGGIPVGTTSKLIVTPEEAVHEIRAQKERRISSQNIFRRFFRSKLPSA